MYSLKAKKTTIFGIELTWDSPEGWLRDHGRTLALMLLGFTAFNYAYHGLFRPLSTEKVDFAAYYNAALAFKYGLPIYEQMIQFFREGVIDYQGPFPYVYPPNFVIFLSPLAYLSFKHAVLFWNLFNHLCLFLTVILLMKAMKPRYSWLEGVTLIFVFMNFAPLFIDYLVGQCNVLLLCLITLGLYFYRTNRDVYAGTVLAMATMIKIIPGLLLAYMLWKRRYKTFLSAVVVLFLIFVYSLLFFDVDLYVWYFKFMANQGLFDAYHDNHSLTGFFSRFLVHSVWTRGVVNSPAVAQSSILATSLLMLALLLYLTRKRDDHLDGRNLREYSLVVVTMLLTSRMTSTPYLVMLLVPIGVVVHELFQKQALKRWGYAVAMAYGLLAVWHPLPVGKFLDMSIYGIYMRGPQVHVFSIQFLAVLVLWLYLAFAPIPHKTDDPGHENSGKPDPS